MIKAKIYIVEDESIVALDLKCNLEGLGYQVSGISSSGEEAIEKIGKSRPNLVLMDIGLSGKIDGIETSEIIKSKFNIPVIYLTANSDEKTLHRAKITDPFGYVLKPFEEKELLTAIEMALYKYEAESKLKASERWLSTTLKSIGDAVIATDVNGRITFMNTVAENLTGYSQAEAEGKPLEDVFHIINEQTREITEHPVSKVMRDGATIGLANHTLLISRNGTEIPIDDSASPIRDENNDIAGVVLVFRDITERKIAEKKILQSAESARNLIELTPYAIIVHRNGKVLYCNETAVKVFGAKDKSEIIGKSPIEFVHPESRALAIQRVKYMMETGNPVPLAEEKILRADGSVIDAEIAAGVFIYEGEPAIQTVARDISERKQSMLALSESEEKYRVTFENTGTSTQIVEEDGTISLVNSEFERLSGYSKEEVVGKMKYTDFVTPADLDRLIQYHSARRKDPFSAPNNYEFRFVDRWGNIRNIINSVAIIPGTRKSVVSLLDITERKRVEEALKANQKKTQVIINTIPDLLFIINKDNYFVDVKSDNESALVFPPEKIIGKHVDDILEPELAEMTKKYVKLALETKQVQMYEYDFPMRGEILHEEARIVASSDTEVLMIVRDITENVKAKVSLRKSEERLTKLNECFLSFGPYAMENIDSIVSFVGNQLKASCASYNILKNESLVTISSWNIPEGFLETDDAEGHLSYDVIRGKNNGACVIRNLPDTRYFNSDPYVKKYGLKTYIGKPVMVENSPVGSLCVFYTTDYVPNDDDLNLLGIAASAIGVEEKRLQAEAELRIAKETAEKADKLKTDFLAQMSHEIRTPINTILSFTSLLKEELEGKLQEELAASFKIIDNGGRRLTRTIDMILTMSQLQSGNYELVPRKLNLFEDILEGLYKEFENVTATKGLDFSLQKNTNDLFVEGDAYTLAQLFQNLIDNAIKYTRKGKVEVAVYQNESGSLSVDIRDTGIGISKDYLPYLFSPFSQEETGYTRRFEGNGLGLSLVKKYAELNNASICVDSEKGKGTVFTVSFK